MKYKQEILILSVFLIFFIYLSEPLSVEAMPVESNIPPVIRFHIRANSDTKEDQDLKLEVRDEILKEMEVKFEGSTSLDESREIILESSEEIRSIAKDVVAKWEKDYDVNVILREESFPVRKYGNLVFPQGDYEALIVEIGDAKGANWWCVMFPPICLVDVTHSSAIEEDEDNPLNEFIVDETQPFKLKSKIYDFFQSFFDEDDEDEVENEESEDQELKDDEDEDVESLSSCDGS